MQNITDFLISKRLGITSTSMKPNKCYLDCNTYHAACLFYGNPYRFTNIVAYGANKHYDMNRTTHAEHDAILKLPYRKDKKHCKLINVAVIKTSKTGYLGYSKPCFNCMLNMKELAPLMGYKIKWIYYSDENGELQRTKLKDLFSDGDFHLSSYYRNSGYKHKLLQ